MAIIALISLTAGAHFCFFFHDFHWNIFKLILLEFFFFTMKFKTDKIYISAAKLTKVPILNPAEYLVLM